MPNPTSTPDEKLDLQVSEDADGSAVALLEDSPQAPTPTEPPASQASANTDDAGHDDDDDHPADDGVPDADPGREAIRQARREERQRKKIQQREKAQADRRELDMLRRQNQELATRVASVEQRTRGADLARLDKAIEDSLLRLEYAKANIANAVNSNDGAALAEAQEKWFEARRQAESLQVLKQRATQTQTQARPAVPQVPDLQLQRQATAWMNRNSWYDPAGGDDDSRVATQIDQALSQAGWDPTTAEYWKELDKRLTKYLPHRYNGATERPTPEKGPRAVVTSSGREASTGTARPGEFRLSADRVRAIKDAGMWDDPAKRNKMIRQYAEFDRNNRGN